MQAVLLDLVRGRLGRAVVGDGRRHHDDVGVSGGPSDGIAQLHSCADGHDLHPARQNRENVVRHIGGHQSRARAALGGGTGDGGALPPRGSIAQVAHRIDRLAGTAGGHDDVTIQRRVEFGDVLALLRLFPCPPIGERGQRLGDDALRLGQSSPPRVGAGQAPGVRVDDTQTAAAQRVHIVPSRGIGPHLSVHGGGQDHGGRRRQDRGGQQIVGASGRDPGQQIGRGGDDHDEIGPLPHRDVLDTRGVVEDTAAHRSPGDRGECRLADEAERGLGRERTDLVPRPAQETDDEGGLVGGDGTGYADDDALRPGRDCIGSRHARTPTGGLVRTGSGRTGPGGAAPGASGLRCWNALRTGSRRGSWWPERPRPARTWSTRRREEYRRTCPPQPRAGPYRPRPAEHGPHRPE